MSETIAKYPWEVEEGMMAFIPGKRTKLEEVDKVFEDVPENGITTLIFKDGTRRELSSWDTVLVKES